MFAAVNPVGIQIVLIEEKNPAAHTWRKTGNNFDRRRRLGFALGPSNPGPGGALGEFLRRANKSGKGARRYHRRRTQIHQRVAIAHPALKISIGRADCGLTLLHETATQTDAGSATGRQWNRTGVYQCLPVSVGLRPCLNFSASRGQIKFNSRGDVPPAEPNDLGSVVQIFETRIHARQQIGFLDGNAFSLHLGK